MIIPVPVFGIAALVLWLVLTILNWTVIKPRERRAKQTATTKQQAVWPPRPTTPARPSTTVTGPRNAANRQAPGATGPRTHTGR